MNYETLKSIFETKYPGKKEIFEKLVSPIFNKARDLTSSDTDFSKDVDKSRIRNCSIFAQVRGVFPITFAEVELNEDVSVKNNRVAIQNCVRRILENNTNAIIFFYQPNSTEWRISYVHRGSSNKDSTNAKRYTYLCGENHACRTVSERFLELANISRIDDESMLKAFSVSTLSDEFFNEYKVFYEDFVQYITGNRYLKKGGKNKWEKIRIHEANKDIFSQFIDIAKSELNSKAEDEIVTYAQKLVRDYIKKLMGRLVFLQFLQKKGWLGVPINKDYGNGDKNFMQNLFAKSNYKEDFLDKVLEPLFFDTLNSKRENDVCSDVLGKNVKIPYLNGGLFEKDIIFDDTNINFPKELFSNPERKEIERKFVGEIENYPYTESSGILDFFGKYNFTIDETDPYEQEIGVDPEMLGKIFENLLEDNKDKGAFYTPKEIVQYMCRESLIAYLLTDSKIKEEKIRDFVINHTDNFTESEKSELIQKLKSVKICDPAVGSGAFPMGMLNELYACRHVIEEDTSPVDIKKEIVKENIYGVDIEKGAVDIARLRFWLAIIVDETEPLPLPNLDYKIMQGNSLLESYEGIDLSHMLEKPTNGELDYTEEQRNLISSKMKDYFNEDNHFEKQVKNDIIKDLVCELVFTTCGIKPNEDKAFILREKILNGTSDFFLWHTWFNDVFNRPNDCNGGFDIVIGNPPYIEFKKQSKELKESLKNYLTAKGKFDVFVTFIELSHKILKENGIHSFINPTTFMKRDYGDATRKFLQDNFHILQILDFSDSQIFDSATTYTGIFIFKKNKKKDYSFNYQKFFSNKKVDDDKMFVPVSTHYKESFSVSNAELSKGSWVFLSPIYDSLFKKIQSPLTKSMKELSSYIFEGIASGKDDVFFVTEEKVENFNMEHDLIHPLLKGNNVQQFGYEWSGYYVIYPYDKDNQVICESDLKKQYPNIYKYLLSRKQDLSGREYFDKSGKLWYELWNERNQKKFFQTKIVNCEISADNRFAVDDNKYFGNTKIFNTVLKEQYNNLYDFITGLLNSNVLNYFEKQISTPKAGGAYEHKTQFIERFPIMLGSKQKQEEIGTLSAKIRILKKENINADVKNLFKQLNAKVYELYNLSPEEIEIIETNI